MAHPSSMIVAKNVIHSFRSRERNVMIDTLAGVSLEVPGGAFLSIVGPSGCGKSTLLNIISGLFPPTSGDVEIDGAPVTGIRQDVGYMFARDALMPWRTAQENVELGLELRGVPKAERMRIAREHLARVGLQGFEGHYRGELSQGMRQRVALARTFALDPAILLMDEPFGALDAQSRLRLQQTFLMMWEAARKTVVFVTHDLLEAVLLSDVVVLFTQRPAHVKASFSVDLPRPRRSDEIQLSPRFHALYTQIWEALESEVPTL